MRLADGLAGAFSCSTMPTDDPYAGLGITINQFVRLKTSFSSLTSMSLRDSLNPSQITDNENFSCFEHISIVCKLT